MKKDSIKERSIPTMSKTEIDLVASAQAGDEFAFNELYQTYYKQAYYFALKITNCDADAQDAVQETFITIKDAIKDLRDPKNFRKWMLQIVLSKCNKIFRKNKYTILDPDVVSTIPVEEQRSYMSGENHVEELSKHEWIMEMMSQLTVNQREILMLMYFNQLSIKEIGEVLQIPEGTVKSRLVSAKTALKRRMERDDATQQFKGIFLPVPLLLMRALKKDYRKVMHVRLRNSAFHVMLNEPHGIVMIAMSAAIAAAAGGITVHQLNSDSDSVVNSAMYTDETGTYTQKQVYYKLRDWAHCQVEMEEKSKEEIAEMQPYYNFLKEIQSPYYERLKVYNHWADDFESYLK